MNELVDVRLKICKQCPLYKETSFGPTCDSNKYMDSKSEISYIPKDGFKRGCGCLIKQKSANPSNHCTFGKW